MPTCESELLRSSQEEKFTTQATRIFSIRVLAGSVYVDAINGTIIIRREQFRCAIGLLKQTDDRSNLEQEQHHLTPDILHQRALYSSLTNR